MPTQLAASHLVAQERLRALIASAVALGWNALPSYDDANVEGFLATAVPVVAAGKEQAIALTNAYIAAALGRSPLTLDVRSITEGTRGGVQLEQVYRRPFVTVWTALSNGTTYEDAVNSGLARARSSATMDVQLAHRAAYAGIQAADPKIQAYRRVADASACEFCRTVNGAFVKSATAMALHNGCGCGLEPVTRDVTPSPTPDAVAIHEHGELGPVLTDPSHHFTALADIG